MVLRYARGAAGIAGSQPVFVRQGTPLTTAWLLRMIQRTGKEGGKTALPCSPAHAVAFEWLQARQ
jgi:hypothetical protein